MSFYRFKALLYSFFYRMHKKKTAGKNPAAKGRNAHLPEFHSLSEICGATSPAMESKWTKGNTHSLNTCHPSDV